MRMLHHVLTSELLITLMGPHYSVSFNSSYLSKRSSLSGEFARDVLSNAVEYYSDDKRTQLIPIDIDLHDNRRLSDPDA